MELTHVRRRRLDDCYQYNDINPIAQKKYIIKSLRPRLHGTGSTWSRYQIDSFKTSVALKSMIILQNLITTNHRKSGKSKDDLKLTELDVVTMRIRYRVNGV